MSQALLWLKTTVDKNESKKSNKARFCTVEINSSTLLQSAIIYLLLWSNLFSLLGSLRSVSDMRLVLNQVQKSMHAAGKCPGWLGPP